MKNLFKNPKTRTRNLLLVIAPFLVVMIICGVISFKSLKSMASNTSGTTVSYKDSIDSMDYHLRNNATDLQEELFHDLQDAINDGTDKANIAYLVAKNYVADFYTWTNKDGTYDIGGMYYVYSPQKTSIYAKARNTYYKYLTYYIETFGSENLLEVTGFNDEESYVNTTATTYELDGVTYEAYDVFLEWTYKNESTFNGISYYMDGTTLDGFEKRVYFTVIINDEGRYEIARAYGEI